MKNRQWFKGYPIYGKARAVFNWINLMATTDEYETDPEWWELWVIAQMTYFNGRN